jgi:two-component system nitrogen regulation sensor histidine kinase NtrY
MSQDTHTSAIALEVHCEDDALRVRVDPDQIEQVLINLVRNALDALEDHPSPRIVLRSARPAGGEILIQVIDNGVGIAVEHLENIFVPFFTTKRDGSGIGLAVSRQLVQMNRGSMSVRSKPGSGSTFTLRFPEPRAQSILPSR